jgi:hypothetical protein
MQSEKDMCIILRKSGLGMGYLEHDELRVGRLREKYCLRKDRSHE